MTSDTPRLHPDGLPVDDTPATNALWTESDMPWWEDVRKLERRARDAETRVAELERELAEAHRVIAWLRGGYHYGKVWVNGFGEESVRLSDVHEFLASSPPKEWKP